MEIEKPQAVINDGFYELVQAQRLSSGDPLARKIDKPVWGDDQTNWQALAKIIPKVIINFIINWTFFNIRPFSDFQFKSWLFHIDWHERSHTT